MRDTDSVFQQFHDGLKLPNCFGWNWDDQMEMPATWRPAS
ncbi:barstar family protein [Streptomyces sp. NRRL F-2747]